VAVVGGGISGLAAALRLAEARAAGRPLEQHLFEAAPRLGGVILSDSAEGCVVEAGPGSFLTEKPQALDLARQLGIAGDIIGSNDRAQWFKSSNHSINRSFNPLRR
jgi:oxygen-dependent protoporphyrinogen oxidase